MNRATDRSATSYRGRRLFALVAGVAILGLAPATGTAQTPDRPLLRTPPAGPQPRINGPRVFGVRPGRPFLYRIPCTGARPVTFAVDGAPEGWQFDATTGIVRGSAPTVPGDYPLVFRAANSHGSTTKPFTLRVGDSLALTPPMGWNSWYVHYARVTQEQMERAAQAMISSGMADYGYMYVNIDDCWMKKKGDQPYRTAAGDPLPNGNFPDLYGMVAKIHELGLRAGIYTSPGPWTCAGFTGSHQHELADAEQFARWGFDFLKYDWCSYNEIAPDKTVAALQAPYRQMGVDILPRLERDIVFNLCQYGMGDVWKWGADVGGHSWRTTGDLGLEQGKGSLPGFYSVGLANARHAEFARPGAWNDPDYLLIGTVGDAHTQGVGKPTALTPDEQYSYMSMWCLMAAPLFFSGDMERLDELTLNVLCNAEVIDIDQDALGKQATIVRKTDDELILRKELEGDRTALGLFNLSDRPRRISLGAQEARVEPAARIRDAWRQRDLGSFGEALDVDADAHGVVLVTVSQDDAVAAEATNR